MKIKFISLTFTLCLVWYLQYFWLDGEIQCLFSWLFKMALIQISEMHSSPNSTTSWFFKFILFLFRETDLLSIGLLPKWLRWPELSQSKAGSQELLPNLPYGFISKKTYHICSCFTQVITREMEWKWNS